MTTAQSMTKGLGAVWETLDNLMCIDTSRNASDNQPIFETTISTKAQFQSFLNKRNEFLDDQDDNYGFGEVISSNTDVYQ